MSSHKADAGCDFVLVLVMISLCRVSSAANVTRYENKLLKDLFLDYNKESRPVLNQSHAVVAEFGIAMSEILDMDEKNQVLTTNVWVRQKWQDMWLRWDPADYGGITSLNLSPLLIWKPDVLLYNNVNNEDHGEQYLFNTKVIISSNGAVQWYSPNILKSSCKINIRYFPFDTQSCKITFGSWTFNGFKLDLRFFRGRNSIDIAKYSPNGEWHLLSADGKRNVIKYSCCPEPYPDLTFTLTVKRRPLFYMNNLILPCIVLAMLTGLSFLFPPETGERISLVITVLLGMTVFMIVFTDAIPSTSEVTPLIGKYFAAVLFEISFCLMATCVPLRLHHLHPSVEMPRWARVLIFDLIGTLMCYNCKRIGRMKTNVDTLTEKNNQVKLSETEIIDNGYINDSYPDVRKVMRTVKSPSMSSSPVRLPDEINGLSTIVKHIEKMEIEEQRKAEWKQAISIIDRLFFWLFVFTFVISSLAILLGPAMD